MTGDLYGPAIPPEPGTIWVRTRDAADVLNITERTVRKRIAAGKLRAQLVNGAYMVEMDRDLVAGAGIAFEPQDPTTPEGPGPVVVQRPAERAAVDLAPLAATIDRLTEENQRLAATAAMYQERAAVLEARIRELETPALPATASPERPWWRRVFGE